MKGEPSGERDDGAKPEAHFYVGIIDLPPSQALESMNSTCQRMTRSHIVKPSYLDETGEAVALKKLVGMAQRRGMSAAVMPRCRKTVSDADDLRQAGPQSQHHGRIVARLLFS